MTPEELLRERAKRVADAIQLKVPDRVPFVPFFTFFPASYAGISFEEAMYDSAKIAQAWERTVLDFQPDLFHNPYYFICIGPILEALDYKQIKWPGHGVGSNVTYQFVEGEYMRVEEYDDFLFDPTGFLMRTIFPRIYGILKPFSNLPHAGSAVWLSVVSYLSSVGMPDIREAFKSFLEAGAIANKLQEKSNKLVKNLVNQGFPEEMYVEVNAPFDYIGNYLRGTKGIMLDMFRNPDKLLEAMEKVLRIMMEIGTSIPKQGEFQRVFIPTHKGLDGFMSPEQFRTFYWPTLKKLILHLIDNGLTPWVLWEGDCTSRLEVIGEIPKGKAVYWFERTDIFKAKETLGDTVCIEGNVPATLLCTGTPAEVSDYCKKLIDVVGKRGGFMMNGGIGIPDEARVENVRAMAEITREYGVY